MRIRQYAKSLGLPVIAISLKLNAAGEHYRKIRRLQCPDAASLSKESPEMFMFFAKDVPVMIDENFKVAQGLFNGADGTMHSIRWAKADADNEEIWSEIKEKLVPGEIFYAAEDLVPYAINIKMNLSREAAASWCTAFNKTDTGDGFIISFQQSGHVSKIKPAVKLPARWKAASASSSSSKTMGVFTYGFETSFAITFHKAQGKTLDKVIIDCNGAGTSRVTVAMAYVGFSRVRNGNDIRMLPLLPARKSKLESEEFSAPLVKWYRTLHPLPTQARAATVASAAPKRAASKRPQIQREPATVSADQTPSRSVACAAVPNKATQSKRASRSLVLPSTQSESAAGRKQKKT
jgi:hypothetical protein